MKTKKQITVGDVLYRITFFMPTVILIITACVVIFFKHIWGFILYGGELITYLKDVNPVKIKDVYDVVSENIQVLSDNKIEKTTEQNMGLISNFVDHVQNETELEIPENLIISFFNG